MLFLDKTAFNQRLSELIGSYFKVRNVSYRNTPSLTSTKNYQTHIMIALKEYIEKIIPLTQNEWEQIEACTNKKSIGKTEILINQNSRFNKEVFVQKGCVRSFIVDNDGNEKTTGFFQENEFISTNSFRTKNGVSLFTYQAITPVSLILIDSDLFSRLLNEHDKFKRLVKEVKGKESERLSNRDDCLLQVRAEEKYNKFRLFYPKLESEIAHHYIASYLGITPVSLSRIRKKLEIDTTH